MSNNIKILLVVLVPLLILSFLVFAKKSKDSSGGSGGGSGNGSDDAPETPTPCTTLGRVEYLEEKRVRRNRIDREVAGGTYPIGAIELTDTYRTKALAAGKKNVAIDILEYAFWAEADLEMKKDGFCYQSV